MPCLGRGARARPAPNTQCARGGRGGAGGSRRDIWALRTGPPYRVSVPAGGRAVSGPGSVDSGLLVFGPGPFCIPCIVYISKTIHVILTGGRSRRSCAFWRGYHDHDSPIWTFIISPPSRSHDRYKIFAKIVKIHNVSVIMQTPMFSPSKADVIPTHQNVLA